MQITQRDLDVLNFYRASELHGGLLLGRVVGRARDPKVVLALTRHAAEEVRHAEYWTATMLDLGGRPWPVRSTYQERYAAAVGPVTSLVLARNVIAAGFAQLRGTLDHVVYELPPELLAAAQAAQR